MKIAWTLFLCALAWHQPNKPNWQAREAHTVPYATNDTMLAVLSPYYAQNEADSSQEQPPKWYATSWAPEWALFLVGFGGVYVAISTLNHLRRSTERQFRAYLFLQSGDIFEGSMLAPPVLTKTGFPWVHISIKNSGQTPAYEVISWLQIAVSTPANENTLAMPLPLRRVSANNLGPGSTFTKNLWFDRPLTPPEIVDIGTGTRGIYLYGRIEYRDAFDVSRFTNFRLRYNGVFPPLPNSIFNFCEGGNDAN